MRYQQNEALFNIAFSLSRWNIGIDKSIKATRED